MGYDHESQVQDLQERVQYLESLVERLQGGSASNSVSEQVTYDDDALSADGSDGSEAESFSARLQVSTRASHRYGQSQQTAR